MVSIRLQRTGRKKHAQFRMVVQDSRRTPTSGKVIANLGFYNPHTKEHGIDLAKVEHYLKHGAQPSQRVVYFLTSQKIDLPKWVKKPAIKQSKIKYPDKLRRNQSSETASKANSDESQTTAKDTKADDQTATVVNDNQSTSEASQTSESDSEAQLQTAQADDSTDDTAATTDKKPK
ncbi:MAG: 30S ribosomal protein S16 [Candidatus Saccharibacteria bacterium]|nr:30S ribosomal protein S16 [Candidatus Saccharibacteria bacterium]MCY4010513.1 30S ribosomal protein S16 [Candidatus Saccharibacteria bacterium]